MDCPKCGFENTATQKYCLKCSAKILFVGERKHVTVLFSDLTGFTSISEMLDPEEVKDTLNRIFQKARRVITKYEGYTEMFIGDSVMAIFGVPKAHEDDFARAIRAAVEIHEQIKEMSHEFEARIGHPLTMHSGINSGLVVVGELDSKNEKDIMTGETINLASRLCSLAKADEILVGPQTYYQAEGTFSFECSEPTKIKGLNEPVKLFKVISEKVDPTKIHRLSGFRSDLVGRKVEMALLEEAAQNLRKGIGTICMVSGDAGTGKSRLVSEFKNSLDLNEIKWRESHAYEYSENISYFPLIDLLSRTWKIEDTDSPEIIREKIDSKIEQLIGTKAGIAPYIGGLYSLDYPELEDIGPDSWKDNLFKAALTIIEALSRKAPTVICLEDMHWADPSSMELFRFIISKSTCPTLFLCVYRTTLSLFTNHQLNDIGKLYQDIQLQDLSPSEMYNMLESLLSSHSVPTELGRYFREKVEGNPFYVEELINSLVESNVLVNDGGDWRLSRPISERDIPTTIQGVISARVDRLEEDVKRILQEASVIGRSFFYDILNKITSQQDRLKVRLNELEKLDMIRAKTTLPDLEYIFKHVLSQNVIYSSLLIKERQDIHERIAIVMEQLFQDRLPEFYETLAFHFKQGKSHLKAVEYLVKSGEKSLARYSLNEAHQYYSEAFEIMSDHIIANKENVDKLVHMICNWAFVFYFRADWKGLEELFISQMDMIESNADEKDLGMCYTWIGAALEMRGKPNESIEYLEKALELGHRFDDQKLISHAYLWLTMSYADVGMLERAVEAAHNSIDISSDYPFDQHLFYWPHLTLGQAYFMLGECEKLDKLGQYLLELGAKRSNARCTVVGHWFKGCGYYHSGDFNNSYKYFKKAFEIATDPFFLNCAKAYLSLALLELEKIKDCEKMLNEVLEFCVQSPNEYVTDLTNPGLGLVMITDGEMARGMKIIEKTLRETSERGKTTENMICELIMGRVYLEFAYGKSQLSFMKILKNLKFILKTKPKAAQKAEYHLMNTLRIAKQIGSNGYIAKSNLYLGQLYKALSKKELAQKHFENAILKFEETNATEFLKQSKQELSSL